MEHDEVSKERSASELAFDDRAIMCHGLDRRSGISILPVLPVLAKPLHSAHVNCGCGSGLLHKCISIAPAAELQGPQRM